MSKNKKKNKPLNDYICDDRLDVIALQEKIEKMTDEEFEEYLKKKYPDNEN